MRAERNSVFISYSHVDRDYVERLRTHLKPLERQGKLVIWDDSRIEPGGSWRHEIESALMAAQVAVLLVSADFLASQFIQENEVLPLLARAEEEGAVIIPLLVSPCGFSRTPSLSRFQATNPPTKTLTAMSHTEREATLDKLADRIEQIVQVPADQPPRQSKRPGVSTVRGLKLVRASDAKTVLAKESAPKIAAKSNRAEDTSRPSSVCLANAFWLAHDLDQAIRLCRRGRPLEIEQYLLRALNHLNQAGLEATPERQVVMRALAAVIARKAPTESRRSELVESLSRARNKLGGIFQQAQPGFRDYASMAEEDAFKAEAQEMSSTRR
jgi:hypothetical protein